MEKKVFAQQYIRALTIAGSDSGGGAGIQADLKVFHKLHCYGMSVVSAVTAQNTLGVTSIHEIPPALVEAQVFAVLNDIGANTVKIGMLFSAENIQVVANNIEKFKCNNIILDPVIFSKNKVKLLAENALHVLLQKLFPLVDVITPNIPEAETILGYKIESKDVMEKAGRELLTYGVKAVILKGGHLSESQNCADCLFYKEKYGIQKRWLESERIVTPNTHGTGCTFSAALAAYIAQKHPLERAFYLAKEYIYHAIKAGAKFQLGQGKGPVYHF